MSTTPVSPDIMKYVSNVDDPSYCVRFAESAKHVPDADRKGNHTAVVNGVFAFPATQEIMSDIIAMATLNDFDAKEYEADLLRYRIAYWKEHGAATGFGWLKNDEFPNGMPQPSDYCVPKTSSSLGMYLEDIALNGAGFVFVMKNVAKKPFVIETREALQRIIAPMDAKGHLDDSQFNGVDVQNALRDEGYDVIYDPNDFIDAEYMPQVCFLDNSAFQLVAILRAEPVNRDDLDMKLEKTAEVKQIQSRTEKEAAETAKKF